MRNLSAAERLEIVRIAAARELSYEEIAIDFNVKLHVIQSLMHSLKMRKTLFIGKRKAELRRQQKQAAISSLIKSRLQ